MRLVTRFGARSALAITLAWVAALALSGSTAVLLFLAPALLIAIPLLAGRYVGEGLIVRLAARRSDPPRRPALRPPSPLAATARSWVPRGAGLIARSLAKRPPPPGLLPQN